MKATTITALYLSLLVALVRGGEPEGVAKVMALAMKEPKQAALVIEYAAEDNPSLLLPLVDAAVKAFPDQAVAIVAALMKAVEKGPADRLTDAERLKRRKRQREILGAAILAAPKLAVPLTEMALARFSGQATELLEAALAAAPAELRTEVAAVAKKISEAEAARAVPAQAGDRKGPPTTRGGFPTQPVRPDLVSPSS